LNQPSSPHARSCGSKIGAIVQTASIVVLFATTIGALLLGFITSAGLLMDLPVPLVGGAVVLAASLLLWLCWKLGRTAWQVERTLVETDAAGESTPGPA